MSPGSYFYAILGRGRWALVIQDVLTTAGRQSLFLHEVRRRVAESDETYKARISAELTKIGAHIAWICLRPCAEVPLLIEAAIAAGLHVVVEKPWLHSRVQTERLLELACVHRVLVAIHFQYCFLEEVMSLRRLPQTAVNLRFSGTFTLSRPDRLGISAIHNLGSHLFAVREYAVPGSEVLEIRCGYGLRDERYVELETDTGPLHVIDLVTEEPLIQRFVTNFEDAISQLTFTLDLGFAARVFKAVTAFAG